MWRGHDEDDPETLFPHYVERLAEETDSQIAEILNLCALVRQRPIDQGVDIILPIYRRGLSKYPSVVADAVDDALHFVVFRRERDVPAGRGDEAVLDE